MTMITMILETAKRVNKDRQPRDVVLSIMEEVGELATEIAIDIGHKNRDPSVDGVLGETIDVIIAAADVINLLYKDSKLTSESIEELVIARAKQKLKKWEEKSSKS